MDAFLDGQNWLLLGQCVADSFCAALKSERVHRAAYATKRQAKGDVVNYIEGAYNAQRRHSALCYQRPSGVRYSFTRAATAA